MSYKNLLVEEDGPLLVVSINRPRALNALNPETLAELGQLVGSVRDQRNARCLILTGAGDRAFVAGADIAAMQSMSAVEARHFARVGQALMRQLEELPVAVIAAVNGFALGGGLELAMACDIILASSNAKFGQPEINLGILPGFGGSQRLPRRVGVGAARLIIYGGEMLGADEALRLRLCDQVVAPAELMPCARQLGQALAAKAPIAMQQAKAAINLGSDVDLEDGCRFEAEAFAVAFSTDDRSEGMRAFLQKRPATFRGK
ncbi:MAG: enoyl-CoA hydratase/isomerase family protein [Deltaproteobacteria bacterium]|nr:enoyl-CoA hydratase/isomerase family protein [Deltaproteobacteria bacterium]